MSKLSGT